MALKTEHVFPPIPNRSFDWMAYNDDTYCGCGECHPIVGEGPTEAAAIADYQEKVQETLEGLL